MWFSALAFGGHDYEYTPIGAVSHVSEPGFGGVNDTKVYFGLWQVGKTFSMAAWASSKNTKVMQATGDPFVSK
jgi:hypothetical protein